ncbi:MAG: L,D-transpeptidase family protein [Nitrospirae bacterium]|nr:L,D-transpeptidase family protein [Nitrospirota bacterium]
MLLCFQSYSYGSGTFTIDNPGRTIVGVEQTYETKQDDTLIDVARNYGVGYNAIEAANKGVNPWVPDPGTKIIIPTQWIIPDDPDISKNGILINLSGMRLFYFFEIGGHRFVQTFPIGIGYEGYDTPEGLFHVETKVVDPIWHVPDHIRQEYPHLPQYVPAGPDNPLGGYWIQFKKGYGIHGTDRPLAVGRKASSGCIRLYPEDISDLFKYVKVGTPVRIVYEPVKVTKYLGKVYIEVYNDGRNITDLGALALKKLSGKNLLDYIDIKLLKEALVNATGLPTVISR